MLRNKGTHLLEKELLDHFFAVLVLLELLLRDPELVVIHHDIDALRARSSTAITMKKRGGRMSCAARVVLIGYVRRVVRCSNGLPL